VIGEGPVRTGVTVVVPHDGDAFLEPVFAGCHRLNGNGELTGLEWIRESGLLTSPIAITNTHAVGIVRDALIAHAIRHHPPRAEFWSLPVVGETFDGVLNDINGFHVRPEHLDAALDGAAGGPVAEGAIGGGTGMICHEFKGGIGTASRMVPRETGGWTVGALVQANYGSRELLRIDGVPIGEAIPTSEVPSVGRRAPGGAGRRWRGAGTADHRGRRDRRALCPTVRRWPGADSDRGCGIARGLGEFRSLRRQRGPDGGVAEPGPGLVDSGTTLPIAAFQATVERSRIDRTPSVAAEARPRSRPGSRARGGRDHGAFEGAGSGTMTAPGAQPPVDPIAPGERGEPLAACGRGPGRLAGDPRIDPRRILDRHRRPVGAVREDDPRGIPVVGQPVRLQGDESVDDDAAVEEPVEMAGVEGVDEVVEASRAPALDPGDEMKDPQGGERVARLGDDRRGDVRVRQAGGRGSKAEVARGARASVDHDDAALLVARSG